MPDEAIIMTADYTCRKGSLGVGGEIKYPVGLPQRSQRCRNYREDVRIVQRLLNRFPPIEGGPFPKLDPDGFVGTLTDKAIGHFQAKWALYPKWSKTPDHIVDPGGMTIQHLNRGPTCKIGMPNHFMQHIPRVIRVINTSLTELDRAKKYVMHGSSPGLTSVFDEIPKRAFERADRHFHISRVGHPLRQLDAAERVYYEMQGAVGHVPQGVILAMDEPPETAQGGCMFTWPGGYHLISKNEKWQGLDKSSIYLCPSSRTLDRDAFVYCMIHELAHYVGPTREEKQEIEDFAYFHKTPQAYKNLSSALAMRNADSFSQFTYDAVGKADFNVQTHRPGM